MASFILYKNIIGRLWIRAFNDRKYFMRILFNIR